MSPVHASASVGHRAIDAIHLDRIVVRRQVLLPVRDGLTTPHPTASR